MPETTETPGCNLCGDSAGPVHVRAKCHLTAPLRAELADGVLKLYCHATECNRLVAAVLVSGVRAELLLAIAAAAERFRQHDIAASAALDSRDFAPYRRHRDERQAALAALVAQVAAWGGNGNPTPAERAPQ